MTGKLLSKSVNRWWLWALVATLSPALCRCPAQPAGRAVLVSRVELPGGVLAAVAIAAPPGPHPHFFLTLLVTWGNLSIADRVTPHASPGRPHRQGRAAWDSRGC